jgi:hypothetical protein
MIQLFAVHTQQGFTTMQLSTSFAAALLHSMFPEAHWRKSRPAPEILAKVHLRRNVQIPWIHSSLAGVVQRLYKLDITFTSVPHPVITQVQVTLLLHAFVLLVFFRLEGILSQLLSSRCG